MFLRLVKIRPRFMKGEFGGGSMYSLGLSYGKTRSLALARPKLTLKGRPFLVQSERLESIDLDRDFMRVPRGYDLAIRTTQLFATKQSSNKLVIIVTVMIRCRRNLAQPPSPTRFVSTIPGQVTFAWIPSRWKWLAINRKKLTVPSI